MLDARGTYRCDAEVGNVRIGWRICYKPAVIGAETINGCFLHYCKKHIERAEIGPTNAVRSQVVKNYPL